RYSRCRWLTYCLRIIYLPYCTVSTRVLLSFPTRRSSDLFIQPLRPATIVEQLRFLPVSMQKNTDKNARVHWQVMPTLKQHVRFRSEEHTSELQSRENLVCRLLLEKTTFSSWRRRRRTSTT